VKALLAIGPPYVLVRTTPRTMLEGFEYGGDGLVVRKLRGKKCRRHDDFMDEIGAALQFFYGFGENWSAVAEMLRIMDEWLPGNGYVLVVEHAEELFRDTPAELKTLLRVIHLAGDEWSQPVEGNGRFDRPARPFHVILETADEAFLERLRGLTEYVLLQGSGPS
jgi:hypothetical protein